MRLNPIQKLIRLPDRNVLLKRRRVGSTGSTPPHSGSHLLMADGSSHLLLADGSSRLFLAD